MSRRLREEKIARLHQFRESLPPNQQGMVILALLAYALSVVAADSALMIAVIRGLGRAWRQRRLGAVTVVRAGPSRLLWAALGAAAAQWLLRKWLTRAVETGRARVWLERLERWLMNA